MSYTSFSENKISEGMVAQFIIHLMLKYREPRFLEVQLNLENRFFFNTWVKVFRIIPQNAEFCRYSFSDLVSVYLKGFDH